MDALDSHLPSRGLFCGWCQPSQGCSTASAIARPGLQGPLPPRLSPKDPAIPRLENQLQGLGPHLLDVGTGWYGVLDAIDGEDGVRQGVNGATVDNVLLEKEGERRLAQLILRCVESPKLTL